MSRLCAALAVAAALALSACGSSEQTAQDTPTATATATATPRPPDTDVLDRMPEVPAPTASAQAPSSQGTATNAFLRAVFDDVQAMWDREFQAAGTRYVPAKLTIFTDEVHTGCGTQPANVGPFYCPADHGVYLDTSFFAALGRRAGVHLGDFAKAFVIAHEVAHHVQFLLGILQSVHAADQQDPAGENARSVRFELQADCLAGVWKHSAYRRGELTHEDLAEAVRAAAVVGSDFQQRLAGTAIRPEDWTHGSSAQRQQWLITGFEQGRPGACDTFGS